MTDRDEASTSNGGGDRFSETITTMGALREVIAEPVHFVTDKEFTELDDICRDFIARSPFVVIGSSDGRGTLDLSPKGDAPGFVQVLDETTLAIPERPGNHRADTFTNILSDPHVGLIFLIPGTKNTLRIRGRAAIVRDLWLREQLVANDKVPELALVVEVTSGFFHCAKCIIRSKLWTEVPENPADERLLAEAMVTQGDLPVTVEVMQEIIEDDEVTRLY